MMLMARASCFSSRAGFVPSAMYGARPLWVEPEQSFWHLLRLPFPPHRFGRQVHRWLTRQAPPQGHRSRRGPQEGTHDADIHRSTLI
jgi:hypothetical protein